MHAKLRVVGALLCVSVGVHAKAADMPCPRQPPPPAIDSAGVLPVDDFSTVAEFAATPSLSHPSRAWVVRLFRRASVASVAQLDIARLRLQDDCNRYDVEHRWSVPLAHDEYRAMLDAIMPHARIPRESGVMTLDGTPMDFRVRAQGSRFSRSFNLYDTDAKATSAVFHDIVAKHLPASDVPTAEWRAPG